MVALVSDFLNSATPGLWVVPHHLVWQSDMVCPETEQPCSLFLLCSVWPLTVIVRMARRWSKPDWFSQQMCPFNSTRQLSVVTAAAACSSWRTTLWTAATGSSWICRLDWRRSRICASSSKVRLPAYVSHLTTLTLTVGWTVRLWAGVGEEKDALESSASRVWLGFSVGHQELHLFLTLLSTASGASLV